jgi:hypothetical protein
MPPVARRTLSLNIGTPTAPAWYQAIPEGGWGVINDTIDADQTQINDAATLAYTVTPDLAHPYAWEYPGYSGGDMITQGAWCLGDGFIPGTFWVHFGGGHWADNFTALWAFGPLNHPTLVPKIRFISCGYQRTATPQDVAGFLDNAGGSWPLARHSYQKLRYCAAKNDFRLVGMGAGTRSHQDGMSWFDSTDQGGTNTGMGSVAIFDLSQNPFPNGISNGSEVSRWRRGKFLPPGIGGAVGIPGSTCDDGVREYSVLGTSLWHRPLADDIAPWEHDNENNMQYNPGWVSNWDPTSAAFDPVRKLWVQVGNSGVVILDLTKIGQRHPDQLPKCVLQFTESGLPRPPLSGVLIPGYPGTQAYTGNGICWDPLRQKFLVHTKHDPSNIYTFTAPADLYDGSPWVWGKITSVNELPLKANEEGHYGKWSFCPDPYGIFFALKGGVIRKPQFFRLPPP